MLAITLCGIANAFAQMHISTNLRVDLTWDSSKKVWNESSRNADELTFFDFNKDLTMFKHTTPTITSSYIIKTSKADKENNKWEYGIVSDVGNPYTMTLDLKNNFVSFVYTKEGVIYAVQHVIKRVWYDE